MNSRFTPGAIFARIIADSMAIVPEPQKGSQIRTSLRGLLVSASAAARVSRKGAATDAGR